MVTRQRPKAAALLQGAVASTRSPEAGDAQAARLRATRGPSHLELALLSWKVRVYLQNLVDHIVIGEDELVIEAKAGAALAKTAASHSAASESTSGEVLADVAGWRAPQDSNH